MINYRYFKLVNGDSIICGTDDDCIGLYDKKTIMIVDPVVVNYVRIPRGNFIIDSYMLTPWINAASDSIIELRTDFIIAMTDVKDSILKNYIDFIDNINNEDGITAEINNTNHDSVENKLSNALESILSNMGTPDDEEDEEPRIYAPSTRSIH